jgi:hypothetical protein
MNEPKTKPLVVHLTAEELSVMISAAVRNAVREEMAHAAAHNGKPKGGEWLRSSQCAERYGYSERWFLDRANRGDIETMKPGKYVLFNRVSVEKFLEEHRR